MEVGLIFSDICKSTDENSQSSQIRDFLMKSISAFKETFEILELIEEERSESNKKSFEEYITENFAYLSSQKVLFKLVGDGIISIVEDNLSDFETKAYEYHKKLKERVHIPFRTVATIGNLECFDFKIQNCPLRECIGQDLSILIKYSKDVNDFKYIEKDELQRLNIERKVNCNG